MRTERTCWTKGSGWDRAQGPGLSADLVIYFGDRDVLASGVADTDLRARYPDAQVVGCSGGGAMVGLDVGDGVVTALALQFDTTRVRTATTGISAAPQSYECGRTIGRELAAPDLTALFVLSDGLKVNGSALVAGLVEEVGRGVAISGGLAGDSGAFRETLVGCNAHPIPGQIAAVGLYGPDLRIGSGCAGGWDVFGPQRRITRSEGNVLLEVDGTPALDLYKLYLGPDESKQLPGSALLFPIRISHPKSPARAVVRTVLGVDHETGSMTFAGDMPEGWTAQLMRGTVARLCAGAASAAEEAVASCGLGPDDAIAAIMVSCIGRRLLLGQRISEEIEAAGAACDTGCASVGFYSFGEIAPDRPGGCPQLHNQTMAVTVLGERGATGSL